MDLLSNPEFLEMLMNRKDPTSISNSSDRILQNLEMPKEINNEQFKPDGPSIFWKGLPIAAQLADALSAEVMLGESYTAKNGHRYGVEVNPVMKGIVGKPLLHIPLKAALGYGSAKFADYVGKKTNNKTISKVLSGFFSVPPTIGTIANLRARSKAIDARKKGL